MALNKQPLKDWMHELYYADHLSRFFHGYSSCYENIFHQYEAWRWGQCLRKNLHNMVNIPNLWHLQYLGICLMKWGDVTQSHGWYHRQPMSFVAFICIYIQVNTLYTNEHNNSSWAIYDDMHVRALRSAINFIAQALVWKSLVSKQVGGCRSLGWTVMKFLLFL